MKLGVLVVFAVVVLVLRESEGRTVSKCELRKNMWRMMPRTLCDGDKDRVLAMVICELRRRSNLNTTYEMVLGERLTAAMPDTEETSYEDEPDEEISEDMEDEGEFDEEFTTKSMTNVDSSNEGTTMEKMSDEEDLYEDQVKEFELDKENSEEDEDEFDEAFTTEKMTTVDTANEETTTEETSDEAFSAEAVSDKKTTTTEAPTTKLSTTAAIKSTTAVAKRRRKRDIYLFKKQCNLPLWRISEKLNNMDNGLDEMEKDLAENMVHSVDTDGSSEEKQQPWSLGCHGLFQLSDGYFCQTDYRYSANICQKSCSAFTDDDLADDLECIEKTIYWRSIFQDASIQCYDVKDFFSDCE